MKSLVLALGLAAATFTISGCKERLSDKDAIRAGIRQHLLAVGTLNMSAMDMDVRTVSINGSQAHAEVEFRPKNGGTPGTGMQVAYNLEKQGGTWVVLKTQPLGGMIQHPDPNQNPHVNQDVHSGMPNFKDILNSANATAPAGLPPGHPPVNPSQPVTPPGGQSQTSAKKPN